MSDKSLVTTQFGSRADVRELDQRLTAMLPGGDKLQSGQRLALAQAAVAHGLDPFNGEIWMLPTGLMIGIKGLRKKAREQVQGNFWCDFREMTDPDEKKRMRIPPDALVFECRLFDSENIRTYTETVSALLKAGVPWDAVKGIAGDRPFTAGYGVLRMGEKTRMEPIQCAMKRAEADAIKRRFDVPFGLTVADDAEPGEWADAKVIDHEPTQTEDERRKGEREALAWAYAMQTDKGTPFSELTADQLVIVSERSGDAEKRRAANLLLAHLTRDQAQSGDETALFGE